MMIVVMIAMMIVMAGVDLTTAGNADGQTNPALCAGRGRSGKFFLSPALGNFTDVENWVIFCRRGSGSLFAAKNRVSL